MADSAFVPKSELFKQLRQIVNRRETGFVTILADNKRSVLLRFSQGKLTHSHCRSKDVGEAIHVLTECNAVKFSYAPAPVENRPELMPTEAFIELLDPGSESLSSAPAGPDDLFQQPQPGYAPPEQTGEIIAPLAAILNEGYASPGAGSQISPDMKNTLIDFALKYMGPIAPMVVDEATEFSNDLGRAIDYIANQIPDGTQASQFRSEAGQHFGNY
ncbi:MAG: hypothetical protein ACI8P9_001379 [Parasphingorhabdus sp.]|jgi:hypothetical protein